MTKNEAQRLPHGLYKIIWKSGGESLAAVGSLADGTRWLAPTNWITIPMTPKGIRMAWRDVLSAQYSIRG